MTRADKKLVKRLEQLYKDEALTPERVSVAFREADSPADLRVALAKAGIEANAAVVVPELPEFLRG